MPRQDDGVAGRHGPGLGGEQEPVAAPGRLLADVEPAARPADPREQVEVLVLAVAPALPEAPVEQLGVR